METLTVEITNNDAYKILQDLVENNYIKIIEKQSVGLPPLPGEPLTESEFRNWIESRENEATISIHEAKLRWESKRNQLLDQGK